MVLYICANVCVTGCAILWTTSYVFCHLMPARLLSLSFLSPTILTFSVSTFWLCKPSLLYPPVSCLIIEVSVCLWGAPQYLLIKASVCVCLFISCCYSRLSPGALMRHKPALPTEAYTVSCHCTSSHSKHYQNEIVYFTLSCLNLSLYILYI